MILDLNRLAAWTEGQEAPRFTMSCAAGGRVALGVGSVANPHGAQMGFDPHDLIRAIAELADIDMVEFGKREYARMTALSADPEDDTDA